MKLWTSAHQTPDERCGTLHSHVFGGARSAQSHQRQPQRCVRYKHSDRSCPSRRPLSPRTLFFTPSPWHSFHRILVAWQPTTVWGLQGNWERRAEDREDRMFCVFCLKLRCCVYIFLSFLPFFSSLAIFILSFFLWLFNSHALYYQGTWKNSCLLLFSHPNPFHPPKLVLQCTFIPSHMIHLHSLSHTIHRSLMCYFINPDKLY